MGADLLVTMIWTTRKREEVTGDPPLLVDGVDFDAIDAAIELLGPTEITKLDHFDLGDYEDDAGETAFDQVRKELHGYLDSLKSVWRGEANRYAWATNLGPLWVAVTGGLSWGDSPTDEFDQWNTLIDADVLQAGGFFA